MRILLVEDNMQAEKFIGRLWSAIGGIAWVLNANRACHRLLTNWKTNPSTRWWWILAYPIWTARTGWYALIRVGAVARKLPVIALVDGEERDRLIAARDMGIRNWVAKETLTPSRLAAEVKSALEAYGIWEEVW